MARDLARDLSRDPAWVDGQRAHEPAPPLPDDGGLVVDCGTCTVRGIACGDCVVTFMLGVTPGPVELDRDERRALDVLGRSGLVPRLRLAADGETPAAG